MRVVDIHIVKREVAEGDFDCPVCGDVRPYLLLRAHRTARVFRLPLLPIGRAVESLECGACGETFDAWILELAPDERTSVATAAERGMLHAMAATASRLGGATRSRSTWIASAFAALTDAALDHDQLDAALAAMGARRGAMARYLRGLEPLLNEAGKERVVHAALFVAARDGRLDARGVRHLREVARAVGLDDRRLASLVAATDPRPAAPSLLELAWARLTGPAVRGRVRTAPGASAGVGSTAERPAPLLR